MTPPKETNQRKKSKAIPPDTKVKKTKKEKRKKI